MHRQAPRVAVAAALFAAAIPATLSDSPTAATVTAPRVAAADGHYTAAALPAASQTRRINTPAGFHGPVDADIAIIDFAVDANHPALDVAGSFRCGIGPACVPHEQTGDSTSSHGTSVAGVAAADSDRLQGSAPGARIWSYDVTDSSGALTSFAIVSALEHIATRGDIEVVNLSLNWVVEPSGVPEVVAAIDSVIAVGVVVVAAAGNDGANSASHFPGNYAPVISVAAISDTDGRPGSLGDGCLGGADDTFSTFSNGGHLIDIAAPGGCVTTTTDGGYTTTSGTSFSAPLVAGAAARLISERDIPPTPDRSAQVTRLLLDEWTTPATGPCGYTDPENLGRLYPVLSVGPCPDLDAPTGFIDSVGHSHAADIDWIADRESPSAVDQTSTARIR